MPKDVLLRRRRADFTTVVAVFVIAATFIPILLAHRLTRDTAEVAGSGEIVVGFRKQRTTIT